MRRTSNRFCGGGYGRLLKEQWFSILGLLLMFAICWLHALAAGHYVDFYPINGTFQNFNPIRRLFDGQIPYKDFMDYLGIGHLYMGAIFTVIFGGNYQASLIAFSFLTFFGLAVISLVVGNAVFGDWKISIGATNIVLTMLIIQPLFFVNSLSLTSDVMAALNQALGAGNSARYVRGLILPICIALFRIQVFVYRRPFFSKLKVGRYLPAIAAGNLAGFSFIWSNDYGVSCFICIGIMTFWLSISKNRKIISALLDTGMEIVSSLISLFLFVGIFTLGHWGQWINATFGTGTYQRWYYLSSKSYYLYDVDFTYIMLIQAFIAVTYMAFLFLKKGTRESVLRYGILGFANMVSFCAVNEYKMLSGNNSREVALAVLFLTVLYEAAHAVGGICKNEKLRNGMLMVSLIVSLSWIVSTTKEEFLFYFITEKDGKYIASMGGYMTSLYEDMEAAHEFLDGEAFFSTYASAQEVMEGTFQPSGTDYIIHVLGDGQREQYLDSFINGDFKYTATMRKEYTGWEYWVERANWFFYRELYQNWHPVFANAYEMYWVRNEIENEYTLLNHYEVTVQFIDDSTAKLVLQTDKSVNGTADIYINYSVDKKQESRLAKLLFQRLLKVENSGIATAENKNYESNYLRSESAEYIPMPITDGYGELTLTASPKRSVTLDLKDVSCERIFIMGGANGVE